MPPTLLIGMDHGADSEAIIGTEVTLQWELPYDPSLRYFRIRRSQSQEGSYDFWLKVLISDCVQEERSDGLIWVVGSVNFTVVRTYHYTMTYIAQDPETDVLMESVGSGHARIKAIVG